MKQHSIKAYRITISSTQGTQLPYFQLILKDYLEITMYHRILRNCIALSCMKWYSVCTNQEQNPKSLPRLLPTT